MILIKHNIPLLRDILLLGKIPCFFIRSLIRDRVRNKEFKLYNYNGIDITCSTYSSVSCGKLIGETKYICFDMRNYNVEIDLKNNKIAIDGNYEKVFNKDIVYNIEKFNKATISDGKISILNKLKGQIKDISK